MPQECPPLGQVRPRSEEGEPPRIVQRHQPGQEQPAEQLAEHPDREEEDRTRRDPALPVERDATARDDHVGAEVLRAGGDRQHRL